MILPILLLFKVMALKQVDLDDIVEEPYKFLH